MDNVVVTGASRGLGLAIAERLARDGFRVVAVARRNSEALAAAAKLAEGGPGAVTFCPLDLSEVAAIPTFVRELRVQYGPIYGLVNNAGLGTGGRPIHCYGKVEMSPLSKVEMSPFAEAGGARFERGRFGDERDGAGAV